MRPVLLALIVGIPVMGVLLQVYFSHQIRRFLRETGALESAEDLERFKGIAAIQMYAALVLLPILMAPVVLYGYGLWSGELAPSDLLFVLVPSLALFVAGQAGKRVERQMYEMPVADEELGRERDRVVQVWQHKPFPEW